MTRAKHPPGLHPDVIDAMVRDGATPEMIAGACRAAYALGQQQDAAIRAERLEAKRKADRERLAAKRAADKAPMSQMSRDVACDSDMSRATPSSSSSPPTPTLITTPSIGGGVRDPESPELLVTKLAFDLADQVMTILGIDLEFVPPGWCGTAMWLQMGLTSGWKPEIIRIAASRVAASKRDGPPSTYRYLEKPIGREHALAAAPLPTVQRGSHARPERPPGVSSVIRGLREQHDAERPPQGSLHLPSVRKVGGA